MAIVAEELFLIQAKKMILSTKNFILSTDFLLKNILVQQKSDIGHGLDAAT